MKDRECHSQKGLRPESYQVHCSSPPQPEIEEAIIVMTVKGYPSLCITVYKKKNLLAIICSTSLSYAHISTLPCSFPVACPLAANKFVFIQTLPIAQWQTIKITNDNSNGIFFKAKESLDILLFLG